MILNVQPHRTTLLCLHVYNVWNALKVENSRLITWLDYAKFSLYEKWNICPHP